MIGLTESESLCIVITSAISGTLSVFGSSIIIHKTLSSNGNNKRLETVYKRILFGMSTMDVFQSIASGLSSIPVPKGSLGAYFAYGNTTTCSIQGILTMLGYSCMFYNSMLSIHYVAKIIFMMKEPQERKKVEPFMHLVAIGYPMALAIYFWCTNSYNYSGTRCFVGPYPYGCVENPDTDCTRGVNAYEMRMIFIGIVQLLNIALVAINMGVVFWRVRSQEKKLHRRFSISRSRLSLGSTPGDLITHDFSTEHGGGTSSERRHSARGDIIQDAVLANIEQNDSRQEYQMSKKTRAVAMQGLFYVLAFMASLLPAIVFRSVEQYHGKMLFPLLFLTTVTFPLQGFLNYLVFIRPQVLSIRRRDPSITLIMAVKKATFTTE